MQHNDLNIVTVSRVLNLIKGGMSVFSSCVRTHTNKNESLTRYMLHNDDRKWKQYPSNGEEYAK